MTDYLPEDHIAYRIQRAKETSTHDGVRRKFGKLFVKTGKLERSLAKHYTDYLLKGTREIIMISLITIVVLLLLKTNTKS